MPKVTLTDIEAGYQLKEAYNANNDRLETAIENTLSRDGTTPNQMEAQLDMNSNKVINVAQGVASGDAVNVAQLEGTVFSNLDVGSTPVVHTYAALTAIASPSNGDSVFVDGEGIAGLFVFDSSEVTAANGGTIFDADDATVGSWVRRYSGPVDVRWFGVVAGADSKTEFELALASGLPLHFSRGAYVLSGPILIPSDTLITCEPGVTVMMPDGGLTNVGWIRMRDVENVTIIGNNSRWYFQTKPAADEQRHVFDIRGATNVHIEHTRAEDCGGDGYYIGAGATVANSFNVSLVNVSANNCRRQGLSIVAAKGVRVINPRFTNIAGTNPQAGIDIEPNSATELMQDIIIRGAYTAGNTGAGIKIDLSNLDATSLPVDILIDGHIDKGSSQGLLLSSCVAAVDGRVIARSVNYEQTLNPGIIQRNWHASGPRVDIFDPVIVDANQVVSASVSLGAGVLIYSPSGDVSGFQIGNIFLHRPHVFSTGAATNTSGVYVGDQRAASDGVANCEIIDPVALGGSGQSIYRTGNATALLLDRHRRITSTLSDVSQDAGITSVGVYSEYSTANFTTARVITLAYPVGAVVTFRVESASELRIAPQATETIRPNSTAAAQQVRSSEIGASITLLKVSATDWRAISQIGTWTLGP
jgi:hypothetical protein